MFGLAGTWFFGLVLGIPLLLGFLMSGKRLYRFLHHRGADSKKAAMWAFIAMILLAGVLSSPVFISFPLVRYLVPVSYLYFLFVGAKAIFGFFTSSGEEDEVKKADAPAQVVKPAPATEDGDCGCDHDQADRGSQAAAKGKPGFEIETDGDATPPRQATPPAPPAESIKDVRARIERRIEGDKK